MQQLTAIKTVHTLIWAFFAACILAIPAAAWLGRLSVAVWLAAIVLVEVAVLLVNGWRCPLTGIAARHTADRAPNFDIYLPAWLARNNKLIFGSLYVVGLLVLIGSWAAR